MSASPVEPQTPASAPSKIGEEMIYKVGMITGYEMKWLIYCTHRIKIFKGKCSTRNFTVLPKHLPFTSKNVLKHLQGNQLNSHVTLSMTENDKAA